MEGALGVVCVMHACLHSCWSWSWNISLTDVSFASFVGFISIEKWEGKHCCLWLEGQGHEDDSFLVFSIRHQLHLFSIHKI